MLRFDVLIGDAAGRLDSPLRGDRRARVAGQARGLRRTVRACRLPRPRRARRPRAPARAIPGSGRDRSRPSPARFRAAGSARDRSAGSARDCAGYPSARGSRHDPRPVARAARPSRRSGRSSITTAPAGSDVIWTRPSISRSPSWTLRFASRPSCSSQTVPERPS